MYTVKNISLLSFHWENRTKEPNGDVGLEPQGVVEFLKGKRLNWMKVKLHSWTFKTGLAEGKIVKQPILNIKTRTKSYNLEMNIFQPSIMIRMSSMILKTWFVNHSSHIQLHPYLHTGLWKTKKIVNDDFNLTID